MKTLRWTIALLAFATLSSCYIVFNYDPGPTVGLTADTAWIETGETARLTANAHDLQGDDLTYEWYENGDLIVGATGADLAYRTWAEGRRRFVTVTVIVRNERGGSAIASLDLTVDPSVYGAVVLFNHSSEDVWYFRSRLNDGAWLGDQLGSDILPAGATYVFPGYATHWTYSWDFRAESFDRAWTWQVNNYTFTGPGDVFFITIVDP